MDLIDIQSINPISQLIIAVSLIGLCFLLLVTYLDNSDAFALKRDWRKKDDK